MLTSVEFLQEMEESPTAQQLTIRESRWIRIGSIAWLKRVAYVSSLAGYKSQSNQADWVYLGCSAVARASLGTKRPVARVHSPRPFFNSVSLTL